MPPSRPAEHPGALRAARVVALLVAIAATCACGAESSRDLPSDGAMPATVAAAPRGDALDIPADAPKVAFLGDSIAAGLHLARDEAFPAILQRRLVVAAAPFHLINAGVSGSTTAGGVARVDWILGQDPDVVVIELGANDGFRGVPLDTVEENLRTIIARVLAAGARPLLLGIRLPPNYGAEYTSGFDELYVRVAEETGAAFVPFFMEGVAGVAEMNLPDGMHPTPAGHRLLADNLEQALTEMLQGP